MCVKICRLAEIYNLYFCYFFSENVLCFYLIVDPVPVLYHVN